MAVLGRGIGDGGLGIGVIGPTPCHPSLRHPNDDLAGGAGRGRAGQVLEPNAHPAVRAYQSALYAEGVPLVGFAVGEVVAEHARLSALGVRFSMPPTVLPGVTIAVLDDGCGNLIQLYEAG